MVVGASNALGAAGNVTRVGAEAILDLSGQNLESSSQSIRSAGAGAFTVAGDFTVDLSAADTTTANSWRLVDGDAFAFESFASTFCADGFGTGIDSITVRIPIGLAIDENLFARPKVDFTP